ncbi:hypothetical protein Avbf_17464, partial [Armadillidium vulgare]
HPSVEECNAADEEVEEPENTKRVRDETFNDALFRVYQCTERKEWLSGRPIRVMPCRNKEWMKIFDICDESESLVLFYESSDAVVPDYYVTYGNLTVGSESTGHALLSVGTHHGNAGDAFCEQVGTEFMYVGQETPYWWGVDNSNWESVKVREGVSKISP